MSTRKTSVSLTEAAISAASSAAGQAGLSVSAWLSPAAIEQAWREPARGGADELYDQAVRVSGPADLADQRWLAETLATTLDRGEASGSAAA